MLKIFLLTTAVFTLSGCATYQSKIQPARDHLVSGECPAALEALDKLSSEKSRDQLVYLMDYGSALQACGDYKKSNQILLQSEALADELDYHSVSNLAASTLLNEEMIQYKGDTFEKLFINVSLALNFIQLGQNDSAMVEVRKINNKFQKYQGDDKKPFELNAFAQYMTGLIYESDRKYDDACISYKDAFFLDQNYRAIAKDMLRSCWKANRTDQFNTLVKKISATSEEISYAKEKTKSELILVLMQGWGPRKYPRPEAPMYPHLISISSLTQSLQAEHVQSSPSKIYQSEPIYSFETAAIKTLDADYNSLVARRVGGRIAKHVMADQIRQKNEALGAVALITMIVADRADLRQWSLYPRTLHVLKIPVQAGQHEFKLSGIDANKKMTETLPNLNIQIESNQNKIYLLRTLK